MHQSTSPTTLKGTIVHLVYTYKNSTLQLQNISFNMSTSLLPRSHLLSLQSWTHVGVVSLVPAPVTLNLAKVVLFLLHGCFPEFLDNFLHSFLLMPRYLLCHDEKLTLSGVMIISFAHKTCDLCSGAFFTPVHFLTLGTSILVSFIGVSYFPANFAGTRPLTGYRPLHRGDEARSQ